MANMANTDPVPHLPWTHRLQHHPWRALYNAAPNSCDRTGADKPERASSPSGQTACTLRSDGRNVPLPGRETNQHYSESIPALLECSHLIHRHLHHLHCDSGLRWAPGQNRFISCWHAAVLHCPNSQSFSRTSLISWSTTDWQSLNSSCPKSSATQNSPLLFWFLLSPCLKNEEIHHCVSPSLNLMIFFVSWVRLYHCSTDPGEKL